MKGKKFALRTTADGVSASGFRSGGPAPLEKDALVGVSPEAAVNATPAAVGLLSDNGPGYLARAFEDYLCTLTIRLIRCSPHHPRTNGKLERLSYNLRQRSEPATGEA